MTSRQANDIGPLCPYIIIQDHICKVVSASIFGEHGRLDCHFDTIDIFTGEKLKFVVPYYDNCDVPRVTYTGYQIMDISEDDDVVSLLTDYGTIKDDLKLPTDEALRSQIKDGFAKGKDVIVSVVSAMGKEGINASRISEPSIYPKGAILPQHLVQVNSTPEMALCS